MLKGTEKDVSKEELEARQAEARRDTAEGNYVIILEDSKRVKAEMLEVEKKISATKEEIESSKEEVVEIQKKIVEVKSNLRTEQKAFEDLKSANEAVLGGLEEEISEKKKEKELLNQTISNSRTDFEKFKTDSLQDLKDLELKAESLKIKIRTEEDKLSEKEKALVVLEEKLTDKNLELEKATEQKASLEKSLDSLKNEIINKEEIVKITKKSIDDLKGVIKEKEAEVAAWEGKIEKKELEYKELETKAFAILKREEMLTSKEAYVRSKFEKAGIPFDEN